MVFSRTEFICGSGVSPNVGLLSDTEKARLRQTRVALPGLGGVGGAHLEALAQLGIGAFHLADPDTFEVANFNRQVGASMKTIGRSKTEVMAEMAGDLA